MDNFDLKKYLVENKVTNNSKISESIISIASLFQRTPSETKLLQFRLI
jgi:hypothetical protein